MSYSQLIDTLCPKIQENFVPTEKINVRSSDSQTPLVSNIDQNINCTCDAETEIRANVHNSLLHTGTVPQRNRKFEKSV